ncbi:UPF0061-domain-containing protein [Multifurca ochricompacta]|uniref:Selenoprotein O n=1 Tax=Multifurca ochricompacta TaxID=376703 RepID=A0AAD4QPV0_9AGAM|nr:UPF0061-domain-containing protein [Multifurca ochricompacta]
MRAIRMSSVTKYSISSLPLPPPSKLLIHNLTPDSATPSVPAFKYTLKNNPSIQRRGRIISPHSHFSHVSPFPLPFPYEIEPPENPPDPFDKEEYVEQWLAAREALNPKDTTEQTEPDIDEPLQMLYPANRENPMELLALSDIGLRDCLPHLDIGDAFVVLGKPSLLGHVDSQEQEQQQHTVHSEAASRRQELIDVLGGHALLVSGDDSDVSFAPWSLRYSGHQFGSWAGQLGDGRAISIHVTPHPSDPETTYELQLKGAGRTPFSRRADGLAVVRSSIREYLCAEAMNALHIPTTRSLSIISLPSLPVIRERRESACIVTRMAPSFLRLGSFEALNPPVELFFFGGGQQPADLDALRVLGEWVIDQVLHIKRPEGGAWGRELILECARRNARMVAGWQAYGFMHGVINTDNVSVLGLTIDYGPYAFMDIFDPMHICNHTDEEGRYAYKFQPEMILYALRALLNALAPLIGAEAELGDRAVSAGWGKDAKKDKVTEWSSKGVTLVKEELESLFQREYEVEYNARMRQACPFHLLRIARLGLRRIDESDDTVLVKPLLAMLAEHKLDFHLTFRYLTRFRPALLSSLDSFIITLLGFSSTAEVSQRDIATTKQWRSWLEKYAARIESEEEEWSNTALEGDWETQREKEARLANPRFVLRQWVLEDVIAKVEADARNGRHVLAKVMQMACNPYEFWGAEGDDRSDEELDPETREERKLCGIGDRKMLGFQCSCSS